MSDAVRPDLDAIMALADSYANAAVYGYADRNASRQMRPEARAILEAAVRALEAQLAEAETREHDEVRARWGLQIEQLARQRERERCARVAETTTDGRRFINYDHEASADLIAAAIRALPDQPSLSEPEPHEATDEAIS